jgi:hypothetical protein
MPHFKLILILIVLSLALPLNLALFYGPWFLFTAPAFLTLSLILGLCKKPLYSRMATGFLLTYALVCCALQFNDPTNTKAGLMLGPLIFGLLGFGLFTQSLAQLILKIPKLNPKYERAIKILHATLWLLGFIFVVALFMLLHSYQNPPIHPKI